MSAAFELVASSPRIGNIVITGESGREYLVTPQGTMVLASDVPGLLEYEANYYCFRRRTTLTMKPIAVVIPTQEQWLKLLEGE
jgi:hypothetical protein